jgi:aspartyl/glutamyl-tRNA(Asn/Gln) amidotransferase C subunit
MVTISREEIIKLAEISQVKLNQDEIKPLKDQLDQVLTYAMRVTQSSYKHQELLSKNVNIFREDVIIPFQASLILTQAPERAGSYFVVPIILDNNE